MNETEEFFAPLDGNEEALSAIFWALANRAAHIVAWANPTLGEDQALARVVEGCDQDPAYLWNDLLDVLPGPVLLDLAKEAVRDIPR